MSNATLTRPARRTLTGPLVTSCGVCRETVPVAETYRCLICGQRVCDVETTPCVNYEHVNHDGRTGHDDRVCEHCAETDTGSQCLTDPGQDDRGSERFTDMLAGR